MTMAMRTRTAFFLTLLCMLLAGCAAPPVIRSEVTAFHQWPADLADKTFAFEHSAAQENDLEYRNYENLVREELLRHGFTEAANARAARLRVSMQYGIQTRDVRVIEPVMVDPWYSRPLYGPPWGPFFGPGYYSPFYDPYWYGPPMTTLRDSRYQLYSRQLRIGISRAADNRKLYDVTVNSEGSNGSLPAVMPYLVRSAFADFPGPNGVPRVVELKLAE